MKLELLEKGVRAHDATECYTTGHDKGIHHAAWEQPKLLSDDVREAFRSLR